MTGPMAAADVLFSLAAIAARLSNLVFEFPLSDF